MAWQCWTVACFTCVLVLIAVHETGHFLAGRLRALLGQDAGVPADFAAAVPRYGGGSLLETVFAVGAVGVALAPGHRWPAQVVGLCTSVLVIVLFAVRVLLLWASFAEPSASSTADQWSCSTTRPLQGLDEEEVLRFRWRDEQVMGSPA